MKAQNDLNGNESKEIEARQEIRRNIIVGSILRTLHRKQGTVLYFIQAIEPYLKKSDRQLFGLNF